MCNTEFRGAWVLRATPLPALPGVRTTATRAGAGHRTPRRDKSLMRAGWPRQGGRRKRAPGEPHKLRSLQEVGASRPQPTPSPPHCPRTSLGARLAPTRSEAAGVSHDPLRAAATVLQIFEARVRELRGGHGGSNPGDPAQQPPLLLSSQTADTGHSRAEKGKEGISEGSRERKQKGNRGTSWNCSTR